ncbi:MAG: hypothetical protein IT182_02955 [Acidobacteria bacterium]|nr:hypothetical protein [Acidobacteriota bacterium]
MSRARWSWLALALAIGGCSASPRQESAASVPPVAKAPPASPAAEAVRQETAPTAPDRWNVDLRRDEKGGGHTIARHVGRTDAQLRARLERESIAAASSYPDLATAEDVVRRTLDQHARTVEAWIDRRTPKPNLAIRHRARDTLPTGRILRRGWTASREVTGAVVVLRARGQDWYVLTSYPENPR